MGLQVGPQLLVASQVVRVVLMNVGQQMLHQLFALGGHCRAELGSIGNQARLDLDGETGGLVLYGGRQGGQYRIYIARYCQQRQSQILAGEVAQLVTGCLTQQGNGAVDGELLQALVSETQLMSGKLGMDVIAHDFQCLAGAQVRQQALQLVVVEQLLIEQLGEAGPDRRLAPLDAHTQSWLAVDE